MAKKASKEEFEWVLRMIAGQRGLLSGKSEALSELYRLCDDEAQINLISSLLERFCYLDIDRYSGLMMEMSNYIRNIGYPENQIAVTSLAFKSDSDSSQALLQDLKVPLAQAFDHRVPDCNIFREEDLTAIRKKGYTHFVAVDEFTGTGSTIVERYNRFKAMNLKNTTLDFCILTGMQDAIDHVRSKGISIKVFNVLNKGISEFFAGDEIDANLNSMRALEGKLADKIRKTRMAEHSLGFRQSESLYYKFNGNIPNNVFPIFWWKAYQGNKKRLTLFTRVQEGY